MTLSRNLSRPVQTQQNQNTEEEWTNLNQNLFPNKSIKVSYENNECLLSCVGCDWTDFITNYLP